MSAVPILLYHSIDTSCAPAYRQWMVTPDRFAAQMAYLAENHYRPVTVSSLVARMIAGQPLESGTIAITFDDGLRDFSTGAMPVLEFHGFPATLYVVAGCIGQTSRWLQELGEGDRPMLDWPELGELSGRGIECGAHTVSHPQLDVIPISEAFEEIRRSKSVLEIGLGQAVQSFAYPHGYASPTIRELVRQAGFTSACGVRHALSSPDENRFKLSRIIVTDDLDTDAFAGLLAGENIPVAPRSDSLTIFGWRLVRRLDRMVRSSN